ncbi:MAG: alpha/beta hydrolase, partial [Actinomycetales bacterium]
MALPAALVRQFDVKSQDGTRIRAWTNDGSGPDVLVTNGLGTNPHAWPTLLQPDSGFRVHGNY